MLRLKEACLIAWAISPLEERGTSPITSCLLRTVIAPRSVVLVDEPESFLHPPQARHLGYQLGTATRRNKLQVFIATHSSDIVRGVLDAGGQVTVIRLQREEAKNHAAVLKAEDVAKLWNDPLLRVSNLLEGLFHQAVVLCEGDSDCRFYETLLSLVCERASRRLPEVLFAHTGGKARLPTAIRALRATRVPVLAIADLDVLSAERPLRDIWEALGHTWAEIERNWRVVKAAVDPTIRAPTRAYVAERFPEIIRDIADGPLAAATIDQLRALFKAEGGWSLVKRAGVDAIPKGDARTACDQLLATCSAAGLHIVPVGELEGFVPKAPGHGPDWLESALKMDLVSEAAEGLVFVESMYDRHLSEP